MGVLERLSKEFEAPPSPSLTLDERTNAYIEKLKQERAVEFSGPLEIVLDDFDGPLDLLLYLVKQSKVSIEDIFISKITDQYLSVLQDIGSIDLEKASEFISIAAILIEVKSKALLPRNEFEVEDVNTAKRDLIQKLEEYKMFKEISEKMKAIETIGYFYKAPDPQNANEVEVLKDMTSDGLLKALQKLFMRLDKRPVPTAAKSIVKDRFTVAEKMNHIRIVLQDKPEIYFTDLFDDDYSKVEIITSFQSLLELLKLQEARVFQEDVFADIKILKREQSVE